MEIEVIHGDALELPCDVLVLKYAQGLYGLDELVVQRLEANGHALTGSLPKPDGFRLFPANNLFGAKQILMLGVPTLRQFGYDAIRRFAHRALAALAGAHPEVKQVGITLHGPGYGLDEAEAFRAEVAGLFDAESSGDIPRDLQRIIFVERNVGRARRLTEQLTALGFRSAPGSVTRFGVPSGGVVEIAALQSAGSPSSHKPHVFVAMPFAPLFEDRFHYGIQRAVNASGLLCERADLATFTGDVLVWVKQRISSASLVVADLSSANPNVYLEVGFAWGRGIPTVLVADQATDLMFDVRTQRCLIYGGSIKRLEKLLTAELVTLTK